jgi:prephenate dehydrogenase
MLCRKLAVIGVGLLGGSVGLAVRERRLARRVEGYVRRRESVAECERAGAVDRATIELAEAVEGAEIVVLGTPVAQMPGLVERLLPALKRGAVVTDVGSVKEGVVRRLEPLVARAGAHFVGSHPMAGAEKTGVAHARADLFLGAVCVVTPTAASSPAAVRKVLALWRGLGARPVRLPAGLHDGLVSRSSHLPHLVAAQLANYVLDPARPEAQALLCANGFRDSTRIASSSPEMWRDIVLGNRRHILRALDGFMGRLRQLRTAIAARDERAITAFLDRAKQRRDAWVARTSSPE